MHRIIQATAKATFVALSILSIAAPIFASEQDTCPLSWRPDRLPGVGSGQVLASTTWDPDGAGPLPPRLVVGGNFLVAGKVPSPGVAAWDGSNWQAMGSGLGANEVVNSLTVHNDDLFLAASRVMRWNGASWEMLGSGINNLTYVVASYGTDLIVGGAFTTAGAGAALRIARWDGATWRPLSTGMDNFVYALTEFDGDLIAAGAFTSAGGVSANRIARWNGTAWHPMGAGMDNSIRALTVFNNQLIAGGVFTAADGAPANRIARWNGAIWEPMGTGVDGAVTGLSVANGQLFVAGYFTTAAGNPLNYVARWNGVGWAQLGSGPNAPVRTLTNFNGNLVAGGAFDKVGDIAAGAVAQWDGSTWSPFGPPTSFAANGPVYALLAIGSELIAGGSFTTAGATPADHIARWNGSNWQSLGAGIDGPVYDLALWNGKLIAGGSFSAAGGASANNVARWTGTNWEPLGQGMPAGVTSLAVLRGDLLAGGASQPSNGRAYVARWSGSEWDSLNLPQSQTSLVLSMTDYNDDLIVGTDFFTGPFRWDGLAWQQMPVAGWPFGLAFTMLVDQGSLVVAGGYIPGSGGGEQNFFVRRFDGSAWVNNLPPGTPNVFQSEAVSLCNYNDALIMGIVRLDQSSLPLRALVQLSGATTYSFGSLGVPREPTTGFIGTVSVHAMATYDGDLVIGGSFLTAGDAVTPNLARFGPTTELPAIAQQPAPAKVLAGNIASFHVATFGGQPQTFQWRKNGANLTDDPHLTGALTDTLTISPAAMSDAGLYDCLIHNACGEVTSTQARLTLIGQIQTFNPTQPSGPANPG